MGLSQYPACSWPTAASAGHHAWSRHRGRGAFTYPCAEAPYHPNAGDMTAVGELVLAALTADHRGTSA